MAPLSGYTEKDESASSRLLSDDGVDDVQPLLPNRTRSKVAEPPGGIAPFLRHLPLEPTPSRINTPFYDREKSIYRKRGSPETEKAWRELTQLGTFSGIV
ncbi:hypothetical protein PG999_004770 [Apiospora kogelbergensis]|uniref:Uncharacterized protein n=1 Tax=Apiospora kogelbergensis TaxID=1337665 RepID=A0AAW0R0C9_9PEZI